MIEVDGRQMTRAEWKHLMFEECPHKRFSYPGVTDFDGSEVAICNRCKLMELAPIAKMIESNQEETE